MIFHSFAFLLFLAVVLPLHWLLPRAWRNGFLLAASLVFYGYAVPWYLGLFVPTLIAGHLAALAIERWRAHAKWALAIGVAVPLSVLSTFKYAGFALESVSWLGARFGLSPLSSPLDLALPVGISFYTFQVLGYVFDVYRGFITPRRSFIDFALFISFFPQLVAGPIERAGALLPQVEERRRWSSAEVSSGIALMAWGFFKKLVVADNAAIIANKVFQLSEPSFPVLWAGVFAFAVQIYADFSAYSDIARGTAPLFGFRLMRNFNHPYLAVAPSDFWRRWHISLSTWFRDYVYIPLGGNRGSWLRRRANILITFTLSGLWHGASWTFVLWGFYHGLLLVLERTIRWPDALRRLAITPVRVALNFVLVMVGWLMFRETDLPALLRDLTLSPWRATSLEIQQGLFLFWTALLYATPLFVDSGLAALRERAPPVDAWCTRPRVWQPAALVTLLLLGIAVLRSPVSTDFIYFRF